LNAQQFKARLYVGMAKATDTVTLSNKECKYGVILIYITVIL